MSEREERAAERRERAAEQQRRAEDALRRIAEGGDLGAESLNLSNEYTDGVLARFLRGRRKTR
jgi:hypothetical protein